MNTTTRIGCKIAANFCLLLLLLAPSYLHATDAPVLDLEFTREGNYLIAISQSGLTVYRWPELTLAKSESIEQASRLVSSVLDTPQDLHVSKYHDMITISGGPATEAGVSLSFSLPSWELKTRQQFHEDSVMATQWIDATRLLSAGMDSQISLWSPENPASSSLLSGHSKGVTAICTISDQYAVSGGLDQTIRLWNLKTLQLERSFNHHAGSITALALQSDSGSLPLVASASEDQTVRFWQPTIGRLVRFAQLDATPLKIVWQINPEPNEKKHLIAACDDGLIRIIDSQTASVIRTIESGLTWIYSLAIHPKDEVILVGGDSNQIIRLEMNTP